MPFLFHVGPMLLSANRLVLLIAVLPCVGLWLSGRAGRVRIADIALLLMWAWISLGLLVLEGMDAMLMPGGISFIETMGAYLLARCFVRDADSFYAMVKFLFWVIAAMFPFTIYETLTGNDILMQMAKRLGSTDNIVWKEPRWGLDRVQGVFPHPILFGVFCGGATALTYYVLGYKTSKLRRLFQTALVTLSVMLSLSSGPLTALIAQLALILWDRVLSGFRQRWVVLSSMVATMYIALEIAAKRSVPAIFIAYFAFDPWTASNRLRIWNYGTESVMNYPFFGVGLGEWARPYWMSSSMDMFWLVSAVQNGLPAALMLQLAFFSLFLGIIFKTGLSERVARYRTGYLVCMVGFFLGGWTVHYWKVIYVFFMFLLGSGAWILDSTDTDDAPNGAERQPTAPPHVGYTRPRESIPQNYSRRPPAPSRRRER
ncbi:O-antigen ligase family protein [Phaeovulum sp.]|uniref:O-antigen ligase family protein n=1 Tax=Phaeovulum sp. TaxID=2934796 RepID=UPI0039E524AA